MKQGSKNEIGLQYTFHGLGCVCIGGGDLLMGHEHLLVLLLRKRRAMGRGVRSDKLINPRDETDERQCATPVDGRWLPGRGQRRSVAARKGRSRSGEEGGRCGQRTYPGSGSRSHHVSDWVAFGDAGAAAPAAPAKRRPGPGPEPETTAARRGAARPRRGRKGE